LLRIGAAGPRPFPNHGNYHTSNLDPNAIFDELLSRGGLGGFEDFFRGQSKTRFQSNLDLTLLEVARGCRKAIVMPGTGPMEINVPPGLEHGEVIEVPVDRMTTIHLQVRVRPHSLFKRSGVNLHAKIDVPVHIALAGGEIAVPTLDGRSTLRIPSGTSSHSKLRIGGAGIRRGVELGAIYYEVRICLSKLKNQAREKIAKIINEN